MHTVWEVILGDWDRVTSNDLHEIYGIDVEDGATMLRPWWWLRSRILGILDVPGSRLIRAIAAREVAAAKDDETRTG